MLSNQIELKLSNYLDLYDLVIPKDHILRKIKEMVDFSFIYDELENKYCLNNGRNVKNPILLFQYLLLKFFYNLSDVGVLNAPDTIFLLNIFWIFSSARVLNWQLKSES